MARPRWNVETPQNARDFGGEDRTIVYRGRCVLCNSRCYGYKDEPCPDPRGLIPMEHCADEFEARAFDMVGPDVMACWGCKSNDGEKYRKALALARRQWHARTVDPSPGAYSARGLAQLPTLAQGQTDDLKLDDGAHRVWLARTTRADGETFEHRISVEELTPRGRWETIADYDGGSL